MSSRVCQLGRRVGGKVCVCKRGEIFKAGVGVKVGCGKGRGGGKMFVVIVGLVGSVDVGGQCCRFRG